MKKGTVKKGTLEKTPLKKVQPTVDKGKGNTAFYNLAGVGIIILLGIIIYSNSFNCSFHFDDIGDIVTNTKIRNLSDIGAWWNYAPTRPVGTLTFALNYHFNQLDVRGYHLVNLLIHLINAILVWWLVRLIFSAPSMKGHPAIKYRNEIAFFTALLFVSHPLATQSVTYIVQRLASFMSMFYFLSLALYMKARLTNKRNILKYLLFAGSVISAIIAMLTKENAFTLPFAILLIEILFFLTPNFKINLKDYRVILLLSAFLGILIIVPFKIGTGIFHTIPPTQGHTYTVTPFNYLLTQFSVIVKYIELLFMPINQTLDWDFPISNNFFEIRTFFSFLLLAFLIVFALFIYKKNRIIAFGIFWFFLTLAIESSIIPIPNLIFEHRTYLPSFGFFLIVSTCIIGYFWKRYKVLSLVILVIMVIVNSFLTFERNKVWKDDLSLWNDCVKKAPNKARPVNNRGSIYQDMGMWDLAIADASRAIEINPYYGDAWFNRGAAYAGNKEWAKAIPDYSRAIEIRPKYYQAFSNRGVAYDHIGQWEKAIEDQSKAIEINPKDQLAHFNRGAAYGKVGQWEKAIGDYTIAIGLDPNYTDGYSNRAAAYGNIQKWDSAIADITKAIDLNPKHYKAYSNRGNIYFFLGQYDKAIADYSTATAINPQFADAFFNRGVANLKLRKFDKAASDFSETLRIKPDYPGAEENLKIAQAGINKKGER